jgi:Fe-S cluster assembly protein SufD
MPGAVLDAPLEIQNVHAGGQTHTRHVVNVGEGARAMFVERQTGTADALVTSISHLTVADDADVLWVILQEQPLGASYLGQFNATIGRNARLTLFVMNEGGRLVRQEILVRAAGEDCVFTLRGANLLAGETHCDVTMVLDHAGHGASSTEIVRNVVLDRAHGVFQGQIRGPARGVVDALEAKLRRDFPILRRSCARSTASRWSISTTAPRRRSRRP